MKCLKDLELIIESNVLDILEKQKEIDKLKNFLHYELEDKKININADVLNQIEAYMNILDSKMCERIEIKLKSLKAYNTIKHLINVHLISTIILTILIGALSQDKSIPKTVFMIHILNFISVYFIKQYDTSQVVEEANKMLLSCISNTSKIESIGVDNFSKQEKNIWRCIDLIINEFIDSGLIVVEMTHAFKESLVPFSDKIIVSEKKKYSTNIIMLNCSTNNLVNFPILTSILPTIVSPRISCDESEIIKGFNKGELKIDASDQFIQILQFCADIPYKYNYELFEKAIIQVKDPLFILHKTYSLEYLHVNILDARYHLKAHRAYTSQTYCYPKVQLKCFIQYLQLFELKIKSWYQTVVYKIHQLEKRRHIYTGRQSKFDNLKVEIELIVPYLFKHIISKLELKEYSFNQILDSFVIDSQIIEKCNDVSKAKLTEAKDEIIYFFGVYGLKKLTNFNIIFSSYNQEIHKFLPIWINAIRNIEIYDLSLHNSIKIDKILFNWYTASNSMYSNKINIEFKAKIMQIFRKYWIYFKPHVSVNGRLAYQGYAAHPHSGKLFRFAEIVPKLITSRGLFHIKIALSCAFDNSFEVLEDHITWVDNNHDFIKKNCNQDIITFVYYKAYQASLNFEKCGTLIRIDESASALAILAHLADCDYLKNITNVTNHGKPIDTYTVIGNKFIAPKVEELIEKWRSKSNVIENSTKKFILNSINKIIIPRIKNKKFIKYVIMPQAYNLTHEGVKDKIIEVLKDEQPNINWGPISQDPLINSLALTIWHAVGRSSPKIRELRNLLNSIQRIIITSIDALELKNQNIYSTSIKHFDCNIKYDYRIKKEIRKEIWMPHLNYSQYITIKVNSTKVDTNQSKRSLLPMLIQSIDGAIIRNTIWLCQINNGFTPPTIHDAACSHPNDLDDLLINFKQSFHTVFGEGKLTNKELIENIWLHPTLNNLKDVLNEEVIQDIYNTWNKRWIYKGKSSSKCLKEALIDTKDILNSTKHYFYE